MSTPACGQKRRWPKQKTMARPTKQPPAPTETTATFRKISSSSRIRPTSTSLPTPSHFSFASRSLLVRPSFVSRCAFVRYSLADRRPNKYRTRKQRKNNEMTTRSRREPIETATRGKQSNLPATTSNHYACFQPFTRRMLQINPSGGTP